MKKVFLWGVLLLAGIGYFQFGDKKVKEVAIWDFDGTIIKGDCSEGINNIYNGLIQETILAGLSNQYKGEEGIKQFFNEYNSLQDLGYKKVAYAHIAKIYVGTDVQKLEDFAKNYFKTTLSAYYFSDAVKKLKDMKEQGVDNFVISASLEIFVRGASETLGIPVDHIMGIKVATENGVMTNEVFEPMPFAEGKVEVMKSIEKKYNAKAMYGFGNSYSTDGPFLYEISKQGGHSFMINGNKTCPTEYKNFVCLTTEDVVGK